MKISPLNLILSGLLLFSIGTNCVLYGRIIVLNEFITSLNPWMTVDQFDHLRKEINRLDSQKYQIIPKGE
jgi:hypothetical protein